MRKIKSGTDPTKQRFDLFICTSLIHWNSSSDVAALVQWRWSHSLDQLLSMQAVVTPWQQASFRQAYMCDNTELFKNLEREDLNFLVLLGHLNQFGVVSVISVAIMPPCVCFDIVSKCSSCEFWS